MNEGSFSILFVYESYFIKFLAWTKIADPIIVWWRGEIGQKTINFTIHFTILPNNWISKYVKNVGKKGPDRGDFAVDGGLNKLI